MNLNAFFTKIITVFLLGGMTLLASCEKSETDEHSGTSGIKGTFTLLPPTVTIEPFGAGTAASRSGKVSPEEQVCSITDKMVNTLTVENISEEDTPADTLKTRALANGVYYRLVVYKQSEWGNGMAIAEQRLCKIGDTHYYNVDGTTNDAPINVSVGAYKIFCYSFNNTEAIPLLPANSTNLEVSNGKDFMSAAVDVTIEAGQIGSTINIPTISLTHHCCKLTGTLTAEDFADNKILAANPTPQLGVTGSLYSSGTLAIASGTSLSGTGTPTNTTVYMELALNADNATYSGSTYIVPVSDQILSATYKFKPTSAPNEAADTKALSAETKSYQKGTHVSFTIKAVGVYELTLPGPATIGGVKWAAKNLDKGKSLETQPWISGLWDGSSTPSASGTLSSNDSKNDYWRWNVVNVDLDNSTPDLPPNSGKTWELSKDPCRQGLGGTWRVPTESNMRSLVDAKLPNKWVKINNEEPRKTNGNGWLAANDTRASGIVFANTPSNVIFLPAAGYRNGSGCSYVGTYGYYWSSTLNESNTRYAYALFFFSNSCSVGSSSRNVGHFLRCVQD